MAYTKESTERKSFRYDYSDRFAGPPVNWQSNVTTVSLAKTKTGEYLPHWKNLVASGSSATTAFTGNIQTASSKPGYMKVTFWYPFGANRASQRVEWTEIRGDYIPGSARSFSTGADVSTANSAALVQVARSIERTNSHFMGGVFLGEMREVVRMISRPARTLREGIAGYISTLGKRKRRAPRHRLNQILTDTWLEYSFGWQPLISDIKAAAETLARWQGEREEDGYLHNRTELRGFGKSQAVQSLSGVTTTVVNNYCYYSINSQDVSDCIVVYRVGMDYKTTTPAGSAARLAELSGLNNDLVGWVPTVWELLPWSFVVDYFSNVGDILSFCATNKSNMTWINKSVVQSNWLRVTSVADHRAVAAVIPLRDIISIEGDSLGTSFSKRSAVTRTAPSALDYPKLEFQCPAFDSVKWINLAALWQGTRSITPFRK